MASSASKPFEVADQQQTEAAARRQARPADLVSAEALAERLDVFIKTGLVENLIQPRVERVPGTARQALRCDPHRRLPGATPSPAHRHATVYAGLIVSMPLRLFSMGC
jgi:hypothetical protein